MNENISNFSGQTSYCGVSIGSVLEFGWGDNGIKPIILVIEKESNPHDHPMLREIAGFIVDDLDKAIELAKKILLPGV